MWSTKIGHLVAKRNSDIRTAGNRGLQYWGPILKEKGWNQLKGTITIWLSGDPPAILKAKAVRFLTPFIVVTRVCTGKYEFVASYRSRRGRLGQTATAGDLRHARTGSQGEP